MRKLAWILAVCGVTRLAAAAEVRALGALSFVVPDGLTYQEDPNGNQASMTRVDGQNFLAVAITKPVAVEGDADAHFRSLWATIAGPAAAPTAYGIKPRGGYGGRSGAASCKQGVDCVLFTLETPQGVVPVLALIPSGTVVDWYFFEAIHQSVRMSPAKAKPPKKDLKLADLVGKWATGGGTYVSYVSSAGDYAGSSTSMYSSGYTIAADGTYILKTTGLSNNRSFREESKGRVEFTADAVVFREANGHEQKFRFVTFTEAIDGATLVTFLQAAYEATPSNIVMYGEIWARKP